MLLLSCSVLQFAGSNIQTQDDCANLMLLLLEFPPLLSNHLLQVPLFFLPEIGKRSGINDWIIIFSHRSGTSSPATNMRDRVTATVQEFCPDRLFYFFHQRIKGINLQLQEVSHIAADYTAISQGQTDPIWSSGHSSNERKQKAVCEMTDWLTISKWNFSLLHLNGNPRISMAK